MIVSGFEIKKGHLNSISNSTTPTFGPSLAYALNLHHSLGFRFLAPFSDSAPGTVSFMVFHRYNFSEEKTSLFTELSLGQNFYTVGANDLNSALKATSVGTNLGIIHHLNSDIAFGGIGGGEWTQTDIYRNGAYPRGNDFRVYARLAMFGSISF